MTLEPHRARAHPIWTLLRLVLALGLAAFVLSKTDLGQLLALRTQLNIGWLLAVILLYLLLTALKALQYYYLLGRRVGYAQVLSIVVVQNAVSNFVATGAGIASYLAMFRVEQGVKLTRAALAFVLAKVGDLFAIWLLMLAASWALWDEIVSLRGLAVAVLAAVGAALLAFVVAVVLRQRFVRLLRRLAEGTRLDRLGPVNRTIEILDSLAEQGHGFVLRRIGTGVLFSSIYMVVTMAWVYGGLRVFSFDIGVLPVVFVNVLLQLLSYLPLQILGGLGVSEATWLYLYGFFRAPQADLPAVLVGTRLLFYGANLVVLLYLPLLVVLDRLHSKPNR